MSFGISTWFNCHVTNINIVSAFRAFIWLCLLLRDLDLSRHSTVLFGFVCFFGISNSFNSHVTNINIVSAFRLFLHRLGISSLFHHHSILTHSHPLDATPLMFPFRLKKINWRGLWATQLDKRAEAGKIIHQYFRRNPDLLERGVERAAVA